MNVVVSYPIVVTFIVYLGIVLFIGFLASRQTHNLSDYILGGRSLSGPVAALGAGASDMSGWLLMALPGAILIHGLDQIWLPIGLSLGAYLNWLLVAKRLRVYSEVANDSLTIPAYLDNRFHDTSKILRMITAVVILIFFTSYAAAGFVSGAFLTASVFHISYGYALLISALVIISYTFVGGFLAVSWIDFFQGSLMFCALLIVPYVTIHHIEGWHHMVDILAQKGAHYLMPWHHGLSMITIISLLAWGLGYCGQPHIIVRFMAAKSGKVIPLARRVCMTWMVLSLGGAVLVGLSGQAFFIHQPLENAETVFLILAKLLFNPWLAGILIAAVLSAIMSTISAQLLASSSALTEDFYRNFFRKQAKPKELIWVARSMVLVISAIAVAMATRHDGTILQLVAYAWAGFGASFGPIILLSLYWPRMTRNGAIAGMLIGTITVIVWEILSVHYGGIFKLYSIIPGFLLNSFVILWVSYCDQKPSAVIIREFDKVFKVIKTGAF